jgi:hypothetical protein
MDQIDPLDRLGLLSHGDRNERELWPVLSGGYPSGYLPTEEGIRYTSRRGTFMRASSVRVGMAVWLSGSFCQTAAQTTNQQRDYTFFDRLIQRVAFEGGPNFARRKALLPEP